MTESERIQLAAYADGELSPAETAEWDRRVLGDPALAAEVEEVRAMRRAVGRAMEPGATPAELAGEVRAAMANEPAARAETSWWSGPTRARPYAIVASLALVCGAVLFGLFGRPIDSIRARHAMDLATLTTEFVASEHKRCSHESGHRLQKTIWRDVGEAATQLHVHMGTPVPVIDLSRLGYRFAGAGACAVPGVDRSCHLVYESPHAASDGCPAAIVSLFAFPDQGQVPGLLPLGLEPWQWVVIADEPGCGGQVASTTDGRLIYLLVACEKSDLREAARLLAGAGRG